jgi:hypothetical protein
MDWTTQEIGNCGLWEPCHNLETIAPLHFYRSSSSLPYYSSYFFLSFPSFCLAYFSSDTSSTFFCPTLLFFPFFPLLPFFLSYLLLIRYFLDLLLPYFTILPNFSLSFPSFFLSYFSSVTSWIFFCLTLLFFLFFPLPPLFLSCLLLFRYFFDLLLPNLTILPIFFLSFPSFCLNYFSSFTS